MILKKQYSPYPVIRDGEQAFICSLGVHDDPRENVIKAKVVFDVRVYDETQNMNRCEGVLFQVGRTWYIGRRSDMNVVLTGECGTRAEMIAKFSSSSTVTHL